MPTGDLGTFVLPADILVEISSSLHAVVESATGWPGLGIIFVYSILIAFALPGPSEVVLAAPLDLGTSLWVHFGLIMGVSAAGKAIGSLVAFHLGQEAKQAGQITRLVQRSRFDLIKRSESHTMALAHRYGHGGLALALCVPFFPDTLSIYAFTALDGEYWKFVAATFLGSLGRLVVTLTFFGGAVTLL